MADRLAGVPMDPKRLSHPQGTYLDSSVVETGRTSLRYRACRDKNVIEI